MTTADSPCLCADPVAPLPAGKGSARAAPRRRLWQLPTQAHELLLAMSFTPEALRREASRKLGQVHHGRCVLKGRDVDVLYSVVHDMVTRDSLSEAFQRLLDNKHALPVRRLGVMREAEALQAAWASALEDETMPSVLWALLTHPLGEGLESTAVYDARPGATWSSPASRSTRWWSSLPPARASRAGWRWLPRRTCCTS